MFNQFGNKANSGGDPFSIKEGRIKGGKIGPVYRYRWTESFFDPGSGAKSTLGNFSVLPRIGRVFAVIIFFLALLLGRTAWLQVVKGEYYYSMAEGNRIRVARLEAKRGIIYDKDNQPLVRNVANFLLYFIPADLPAEPARTDLLARVCGILGECDLAQINEKLGKIDKGSLESFVPLFIEDNIPYEKAVALILESDSLPGVVVSNRTRREYIFSSRSMSHLLGYTGKISETELAEYGEEYQPIDYVGKSGLEDFWENELRGFNGKKFIEVDALGKENKIISQTEPRNGRNLVLALDSGLQAKAEAVLARIMQERKKEKGVVIVLDPNNGEIKTLVSLPSFDNNLFARGITNEEYSALLDDPDNPLFSRAVSGEFPAGSTIKPVLAAAALEEGIIDENTSFLSNGGVRVGQWFFPDWKAGGHGTTDARKAIAESVNTFFYIIGGGLDDFVGLGPERIMRYEKLFGFGSQLGIDVPGEAAGFLPTKEWKQETTGERWYIGNTYNISIGQGDTLVTPLQIAAATAFFANGGKLYRPHLVREITDDAGQAVSAVETKPIREGEIKDYNVRIVREGMRQTVTAGSGRWLADLPVAVAGKTGTAQWSTKKDNHAWFTGFAPFDKPEMEITVLVEEGGEGSDIAVKIAKEILAWYFASPEQRDVLASSSAAAE